jgi:Ca2+-binding EF-hand superfamily protein
MKRLFRSRLPVPLTTAQLEHLAKQTNLPFEDIQDSYERFNHCYPRGYLSSDEFLHHLIQFYTPNRNTKRPKKTLIKQLFRLLDLNENQQLNFDEFFLFNSLITRGSAEEKIRLISRLYDPNKNKYLTRQQLEQVLSTMFDILQIERPPIGLAETIDRILQRTNINQQSNKISWHTFSTYLLEDTSLLQLLLSNEENDDSSIVVTRF